MNNDVLRKFTGFDNNQFNLLITELGYSQAACYRFEGQNLINILGDSTESWPPVINSYHYNYTTNSDISLPLGWKKLPKYQGLPKGVVSYLPDQDFSKIKIVFFVKSKIRRKIIEGTLDGAFESIAKRIIYHLEKSEIKYQINEKIYNEYLHQININTKSLIEHELKTPITIINGYTHLINETEKKDELSEYSNIIFAQIKIALNAIDLLIESLSINLPDKSYNEMKIIPLLSILNSAREDIYNNLKKPSLNIKIISSAVEKEEIFILAKEDKLKNAFYEVLMNAVNHSSQGNIDVILYSSKDMAIIDIEDDGEGVPEGTEDLVFLRFFQSMGTNKKTSSGLGMGLYFAREVVKKHMGQLVFVRKVPKGGLFRFIIPKKINIKTAV